MRVVTLPKVVQFLCIVLPVLIISNTLWPSVSFRFVSEPLFVFPVLNVVVLAIVVRSRWSSSEELERLLLTNFLSCPSSYEQGINDKHDETRSENSDADTSKDSDDSDDKDDEDENGSGGQGMDEDEDEDEYDGNLEKRIEDFINKVNKGWREERLRDILSNQFQSLLL